MMLGEMLLILPASRPQRLPYGLVRLSEMINCDVHSLGVLCGQLMFMVVRNDALLRSDNAYNVLLEDAEKAEARQWLDIAERVADDYEWDAVKDRIVIFRKHLDRELCWGDYSAEWRVLKEAIEAGLRRQLIYRYSREKGAVLERWQSDWEKVLASFPSARTDIIAAVDCWALNHSTASVFHLMRVLEHGLRALAADVGKTFDVETWHVIIDQIEAEIRLLGKSLPRGKQKSDRLKFLSEAAKEFVYFKDGWRNYAAHNRANYDGHHAQSVMQHVRVFMTVLSLHLQE